MRDRILRALGRALIPAVLCVLTLVLPGHGSHRAAGQPTPDRRTDSLRPATPTGAPPPPRIPCRRSPYATDAVRDRAGQAPLPAPSPVRRYAPARYHWTAQERAAQRRRRRELWLATVGVDAGPHIIHGVMVGGVR